MADNDKIIISRIQHRRGLKQDLPQPLRPGEIGFATDSRQVYIGGDSNHPNSSQYNAVSYFENTLNAQEFTQSIVDNQLIAFTVPGIKFAGGEFNGISRQKSWTGDTARSTTSAAANPRCAATSAQVPVFSDLITTPIVASVAVEKEIDTGPIIVVVETASGTQVPASRIQVGDLVTSENSGFGINNAQVTEVQTQGLSPGHIEITFENQNSGARTLTVGERFTIISASMHNMFQGNPPPSPKERFNSANVTVSKNGVRLIPDANSELISQPNPTADYVLDATNVFTDSDDLQTLTLRTAPGPRDEITVVYYGNAQVAAALGGVNGKISTASNFPSFYTDKQIPDFLKIDAENVRVSDLTGLGYIALDTRHITGYALSTADISTPDNLGSTGNLLISRTDSKFDVENSDISVSNNNSLSSPVSVDLEFDSGSSPEFLSGLKIFTTPITPTERSDYYRYDHLVIESDNVQDYIAGSLYKVSQEFEPDNTVSKVSVEIADISGATVARAGTASNATITGNTAGIENNDLVTVFYANANTQANVVSVSSTGFELDANIPASNVTYVNHGTGTASDSFQVVVTGQAASLDVSQVTGVGLFDSSAGGSDSATDAAFTRRDADTIFVDTLPAETDFAVDPNTEKTLIVRPRLDNPTGIIKIRPVLSIYLGNTNTLTEVASVVNENRQISIPAAGISAVSQGSDSSVEIFPALEIQPTTNNRVYLTQRPGYSSIDVGGLNFELHEDPETPLLQRLNLDPRTYTRADTVRAKLENWLDALQKDRSTNLFTQVMLPGEKYTSQAVDSLGTYNLVIDDVFGEVLFCDRTEAENFNYLVNNLYADSAFIQRTDSLGSARGLVNIKNNIELQTNEAAGVGEKIATFLSMETATLLPIDANRAGKTVFSLDITQFNNFVIDYSIADQSGPDTYQRTGTMHISARADLADSAIISDTFVSYLDSAGTRVEPKFEAAVSTDGTSVEIKLANQDPTDLDLAYDINAELAFRYAVRRWSSFN